MSFHRTFAAARVRLRIQRLIGAAVALLITGCADRRVPLEVDVWIRRVHVIDTQTGAIRRDQAIAVRNDTIAAIVSDASVPAGSTARMVDGDGAYAIPGLWDAHVHLMQGGGDGSVRRAAQLLSYGITHARDMGSSLAERDGFIARVQADPSSAPIVLSAGPMFWAFTLPYGDAQAKMLVEDPSETDRAVDVVADAGVDFVKVYAGFTPDRLKRLATAATRRGLRVAGHAQPSASLAEQAGLGLTTVEHLDILTLAECSPRANAYFERVIAARFSRSGEAVPAIYAAFAEEVDTDACRAGLRRAADAGLVLTPTLVTAFLPLSDAADLAQRIPEDERESCNLYLRDFEALSAAQRNVLPAAGRRLMRIVLDAGLPVMAGTDSPALCAAAGASLVRELALLGDAGLPPLGVLQAATSTPARVLGRDARLGRLAAGSAAHVLLLRENPLASTAAFARPVGLYTRGLWRTEAALVALRRH
jgi:imidazolonepropionase-like amidohydrolase